MTVMVESRDLLALIEPHLQAGTDENSPLANSARKLAAVSDKLASPESAIRYLRRVRELAMNFVTAERADDTVLALLEHDAPLQLRSLPHHFNSLRSATEAAEAYYADDDTASATDVQRLARSLYNFSKGWAMELVERHGRSLETARNAARKEQRQAVAA